MTGPWGIGRPFGAGDPLDVGDPFDVVLPRYDGGSLADVLPGALAVLGVPGAGDRLGLTQRLAGVRRVAVLLVDGLGWHQIPEAARHAPTLVDLARRFGRPLTSGFPSTTPTSLVSLGTGAAPGAHGVLGFRVNVPGTDRVLTHIDWPGSPVGGPGFPGGGPGSPVGGHRPGGSWSAVADAGEPPGDPDPRRWQPLSTQFELAEAAGVAVTVVSRAEFAGTGLTIAANRGGEHRGAADAGALAREMLSALNAGDGPNLVYGYYPDLDRHGHLSGVGSADWQAAVAVVDDLLARLVDGLPGDAALLVTADHGQLNVPPDQRFDLDTDPRLRAGVRVVAGEPRVRYLHAQPGAVADVVAAWSEVLGESAWIATRAEAVAAGWFGPVPQAHLPRIGDVVVACLGSVAVLASQTGSPIESRLIAYHGSCTATEMIIPLLAVAGGDAAS